MVHEMFCISPRRRTIEQLPGRRRHNCQVVGWRTVTLGGDYKSSSSEREEKERTGALSEQGECKSVLYQIKHGTQSDSTEKKWMKKRKLSPTSGSGGK